MSNTVSFNDTSTTQDPRNRNFWPLLIAFIIAVLFVLWACPLEAQIGNSMSDRTYLDETRNLTARIKQETARIEALPYDSFVGSGLSISCNRAPNRNLLCSIVDPNKAWQVDWVATDRKGKERAPELVADKALWIEWFRTSREKREGRTEKSKCDISRIEGPFVMSIHNVDGEFEYRCFVRGAMSETSN